jgi:hypothetical protein
MEDAGTNVLNAEEDEVGDIVVTQVQLGDGCVEGRLGLDDGV